MSKQPPLVTNNTSQYYRSPQTLKPVVVTKKLKLHFKRGTNLNFSSPWNFYFSLGDGGRLFAWTLFAFSLVAFSFLINFVFTGLVK